MTDWQPIETAPLDRPILLATKQGVCIGKREEFEECFLVNDDGDYVFDGLLEGSLAKPSGTVIYWAPLPVLLTSA